MWKLLKGYLQLMAVMWLFFSVSIPVALWAGISLESFITSLLDSICWVVETIFKALMVLVKVIYIIASLGFVYYMWQKISVDYRVLKCAMRNRKIQKLKGGK